MKNQKIGVKKKNTRRGSPVKNVELRSSLGIKMSKMVYHFDLAFQKLHSEMWSLGRFSYGDGQQEAKILIEKAQQAVQDFSTFMGEFCKEVGFEYHPPKNIVPKMPRQSISEEDGEVLTVDQKIFEDTENTK